MSEKKVTTQLNTRVEPEKAEKFRDMCEQLGFTQAQGIEAAIDALEASNFADKMPGRRDEIERFMRAMATASEIYKNSLEICDEADERARDGFKTKIDAYEKQVAQQSDEIERLQAEKQVAESAKDEAAKEAGERIERLEADLQREMARADQAEARVIELEQRLSEGDKMAELLNTLRAMIQHQPDVGSEKDGSQY